MVQRTAYQGTQLILELVVRTSSVVRADRTGRRVERVPFAWERGKVRELA